MQIRALTEMSHLVFEIENRLKNLDIKIKKSPELQSWSKKETNLVLKIIICGAFYPYYFYTSSVLERESFHILAGRDPCNTVFFKGFDPNYIGVLYEKNIKQLFKDIAPMQELKVTFDNNSQRIFVTFSNSTKYYDDKNDIFIESMPGRVLTEIYKAVKMRKLTPKIKFPVMNKNDAAAFAERHALGKLVAGIWYPEKKKPAVKNVTKPAFHIKEMEGIVTHIIHCNKFYFRPNNALKCLTFIHNQLKESALISFEQPSEILVGEIVVAPDFNNIHEKKLDNFDDEDDVDDDHNVKPPTSFIRAKIIGFNRREENDIFFDVFYIDFGNTGCVQFRNLRKLSSESIKNIPPCVLPCSLCCIKPSCFDSPQEIWTKDALNEFRNFTKNSTLVSEIYSYVNGIASVYLKKVCRTLYFLRSSQV